MVIYSPGRTTSVPEDPPDNGIRFHFLGGGDEVGNVGCFLEDNKSNRLILDYGLAPTTPPRYPKEAPKVNNAVITHSHIDHLGMAPWLVANHRTKLHGTSLTAKISELMWHDCYKVSKIEGYPLTWDKRDIDYALNSWIKHPFGESWKQESWKLTLEGAGHIPGAAMLHIETEQGSIMFTGDFDTRDSPMAKGAEPKKCDTLFVEGTYGGRNHPNTSEEIKKFCDRIVEVTDRGGTALIPAFANGRTQDIVMHLHQNLPELNVHVDGMGKRISKFHLDEPTFLRDANEFSKAWGSVKKVSSKSDRKKALDADCIVSTSGMLEGGPSIWYLNRLRHDERNAVLLTGYQAKDSGGRMLLDEKRVPIWGDNILIPLEVNQFNFSTHAGHNEIIRFAELCEAKKVVIYHSDSENARPHLAKELEKNGHQVFSPNNYESHII